MKLVYVEASGFRGYRNPVRIDFAPGFTVIDGRNGVGKSTIFDAVEFALTGKLSKYKGATAAGQTVADYLWWIGDDVPKERYVEVKFSGNSGAFTVRRTPLDPRNFSVSPDLIQALAQIDIAPQEPLEQLCAAAIIRDEHIAGLSLDLKETERYALLRQAIGANDADSWVARAHEILVLAKRRSELAQNEINSLTAALAATGRRIDELRSSLYSESTIADAAARLQKFAETTAPPDSVVGTVRLRMAAVENELAVLSSLRNLVPRLEQNRALLLQLRNELPEIQSLQEKARDALAAIEDVKAEESSGELAQRARDLVSLIQAGRNIGLIEHHCPLCSAPHTDSSFQQGMAEAELAAARIDEISTALAQREAQKRAAAMAFAEQERRLREITSQIASLEEAIQDVEQRCIALSVEPNVEVIDKRVGALRFSLETAQRDIRVLDTLRLNGELTKVKQDEQTAKQRLARGQERFGRARKTEAIAGALHDAARRAAAETLDLRLDRVLPLMAELYQRLKPHPVWQDIEYAIRGDIRRFLSLRVGEDLNPQFLFSSGQRRATGLAFLLSINLSITWSRWHTLLLDDPVQHVDDFRAVHLAEVLAQLVGADRQVICAVEDPALADLMCRRLPIKTPESGLRVTLGPDQDGVLSVRQKTFLKPLPARAFAELPQTRVG